MHQRRADAQAQSARIIEDGKANVSVLNAMIATWKQGGKSAHDIFLMQKMQVLMESLVGTITDVKVDRVTLLPGDGDSTAQRAVTLVEELKAGVGIDIPEVINRLTAGPTKSSSDG
jgi:flotillin